MINFTDLSVQEAQLIWNALMELPGKMSYPLVKKLEKQLQDQGQLEKVPSNELSEVV